MRLTPHSQSELSARLDGSEGKLRATQRPTARAVSFSGLERRFGLPNAGITGYLSRRVSINGGQFAAASKPAIMPSDILQHIAGIEWLIAVIVLDT